MSKTDDHIVIDEVITIDPAPAKTERADFASIVFHNIAETYPDDAHIQCCYTVTSDMTPTTRDYVALYKVGWMSPRDYIYYEWAPTPKDYVAGQDADASVLFPAHKLPNDNGEFYQFCYVSSTNQIRGASTPFQFRKPGTDDYVEVEDEETNMLVIKSKTIYLEETLQKAENQRQKLVETQEALQKERDNIITKYQETKNKLVTMETDNKALKSQVTTGDKKIQQLKMEFRDMVLVRDEMDRKISKLNQEISECKTKMDCQTEKINVLEYLLKTQQTENDELAGENTNLNVQVQLYKNQCSTTESSVERYTKHSEDLQVQINTNETLIEGLQQIVDKLNMELEDNRANLDQQIAINIQDKDQVKILEERIRNAEDKLGAAEERKEILQKEIITYKETQQQLSQQIERSKSECENVKQKMCRLEQDFTYKTEILKGEIAQITNDFKHAIQEKQEVQKENSVLIQDLNKYHQQSGVKYESMSILKQTLTQIKERLEKKEKKCLILEKRLQARQQEFWERERELRREIEDLQEKIYMCSEEYKALYIEKSKLSRKLTKAQGKRKSKTEKATVDTPVETVDTSVETVDTPVETVDTPVETVDTPVETVDTPVAIVGISVETVDTPVETVDIAIETLVRTQTEATQDEPPLQSETTVISGVAASDVSEISSKLLEAEVENLTAALEKKLNQKQQYKELYLAEKTAKQHLERQLQDKQQQVDNLKTRIVEIPAEWETKMCSLERCVTEKEQMIEKLNQQLRTANPTNNGPIVPPARYYPSSSNTSYPYFQYMGYPQQTVTYPYPPTNMIPQQISPPCPMIYPHQRTHTTPNLLISVPAPTQDPSTDRILPPVPPRKSLHKARAPTPREPSPTDDMLDGEDERGDLDKVLTPLPAPLEPEKIHSAKIAAVNTLNMFNDDLFVEEFVENLVQEAGLMVNLPNTDNNNDNREDRFYDAEGASMMLCPVCSRSFPADVDETVFQEHQLEHLSIRLCPYCKMSMPENMTDEEFYCHVNKHLDAEEAEEEHKY